MGAAVKNKRDRVVLMTKVGGIAAAFADGPRGDQDERWNRPRNRAMYGLPDSPATKIRTFTLKMLATGYPFDAFAASSKKCFGTEPVRY